MTATLVFPGGCRAGFRWSWRGGPFFGADLVACGRDRAQRAQRSTVSVRPAGSRGRVAFSEFTSVPKTGDLAAWSDGQPLTERAAASRDPRAGDLSAAAVRTGYQANYRTPTMNDLCLPSGEPGLPGVSPRRARVGGVPGVPEARPKVLKLIECYPATLWEAAEEAERPYNDAGCSARRSIVLRYFAETRSVGTRPELVALRLDPMQCGLPSRSR
jgi:hypothetical protein